MKEAPAIKYDPVAVSAESTVVAEYVATYDTGAAHQSVAQPERGFIATASATASPSRPHRWPGPPCADRDPYLGQRRDRLAAAKYTPHTPYPANVAMLPTSTPSP
jgi:hypothetical protein